MSNDDSSRGTRFLKKIGLYAFLWLKPNPAFVIGNTARIHLIQFGSMLAAGFQFERYGKALQLLFGVGNPVRKGWLIVNPVVTTSSVNTSTVSPTLNATNMGTYYRYTFTGGGLTVASSETRHNRAGEIEFFTNSTITILTTITNEAGVIKL